MAKIPNWLDVEHRPIENGAGDERFPRKAELAGYLGNLGLNTILLFLVI